MCKDKQNNNKKPEFNFSFLKNLLLENGLGKELRHLPKFEHFLFLLIKEQKEQSNYVPVSNRLLKQVMRQPIINRVKEHLKKLGLIECNFKMRYELKDGERIGIEPYSYKLTDKFYQLQQSHQPNQYSGCALHNTITNSPINQKISVDYKYNGNGDGLSDERINALRDEFLAKCQGIRQRHWSDLVKQAEKPEYLFIENNAKKLTIDLSVYDWIEEQVKNKLPLKPAKSEFINEKGKLVKYLKKDRYLTEDIASHWKNHVEKIEKGTFQFSCSVRVGRVYYNITSMPSQLRNFLRYQGDELFYLDYSNFQPFLFNKILKEKYGNELPADAKKYIELTCEGLFYAEVKQHIEAAGIEIKDPASFKTEFFGRVFFSSEKRKYKYRTVFEQYFPSVSATISEVKKGNFKALSIQLQKLEAQIVISTILNEITGQKPDAFVLPIHDALICEKEMFVYVQRLMIERAEQIIGCRPKIKFELLTVKIN
jgi:hypothetical protein